jgi:glycosyltransferase involved in cell wall biosynthesis
MKKVSIVIGTKNEEKNIKLLLESIEKQTYKNIETIIVDNFSTDKTKEISEKYQVKFFEIGPERSTQRNFGAEKSQGEYVLVLDADMVLDLTLVEDCVNKIEKDKNIKALIIPELSFGEGYWSECKALERNCYLNDTGDIYAPRFYYRSVFLEVGGFNKDMISGEDWDLRNKITKAGYKIDRVQTFIHHNEGNRSLIEMLKKKIYYAQNAGPYIENNVKGFWDIVKFVLRPALYKNIGELAKHPLHLPGVFFMVYSEFFVGFFAGIIFKREFWSKMFK